MNVRTKKQISDSITPLIVNLPLIGDGPFDPGQIISSSQYFPHLHSLQLNLLLFAAT